MSRQLSRLAESAYRPGNLSGRSNRRGLGPIVGSVSGSGSRVWLQHRGAARYAIRCFVGSTGNRITDERVERGTRNDFSRIRRGTIQPSDCRTDRATACTIADPNSPRLGQRSRCGIASIGAPRGSQGSSNSGLPGFANCGQSRVTAFGRGATEQLVRITSTGRPVGSDHVSFIGRQIGQERVAG